MAADPVRLVELRFLQGPNLYFTAPAVKLTLSVPGLVRASEPRAEAVASRVGVRVRGAGAPGSEERRRLAARVAAEVTRSLASAASTRLGVRARPGEGGDEVVVAYPWRRRNAAEALGQEVSEALRRVLGARTPYPRIVEEAAARLRTVPPGDRPNVPAPRIPVIAVTGTNGKTTTVRLLAHILQEAGRSVAYTTTDGVYAGGRRIEEGDYSGPAGAATALAQPGIDVAVLEVARGGILLKGIGMAHNDVAVVTNVSADHIGLHGIRTLDQLAEVKSTITRITKPDGWCVLNADDPRVLGMRSRARGRPFLFSLDPDHPAIREALTGGGRALAPLDGWLVVMQPGPRLRRLVPLEEVPVTLAGISSQHTQNAMAATAAALAISIPEGDVAAGLRSFVLDPERNPGRANLVEVGGVVVVVDYAHNEAGIHGLVEICRGLLRPGARVWIAVGSAGDRSDEIIHGMGYIAARGADRVVVVEQRKYLRGRERDDVIRRLRAGAEDGGARDVPDFPTEIEGFLWVLQRASRGDVIGITALAQRMEMFELMRELGGRRIGPARCRQLVRRARGG